jgi:hypothetical protein
VASSALEIEPEAACPVATVFNKEDVTVLLEEAKVVAKRDNRAAAAVQAVRARVREVAAVVVEAEAAVVAAEAVEVAAEAADKSGIIDAHNLA